MGREAVVALLALCVVLLLGASPGAPSGQYGFGAHVTGGAGGTRVQVDTLTWISPTDVGFSTADCTDGDSGDCSIMEAICPGNRYVEFSVTGDIVVPVSWAGVSGVFEFAECPAGKISNLTIDGATAPGAGVQFRGGQISINGGSQNIIIRHVRFRQTLGANPLYQGAPVAITNAQDVVLDHVSTAHGGAYALAIAPGFSGETNQPVRRVTIQNSLFAWTLGCPNFDRAVPGQTVTLQGDTGRCSNDAKHACVLDSNCTGGGTCTNPAPGAHAYIQASEGRCFGGLDAGASCVDDRTCRHGYCYAYCDGTGAHVGKRAGLAIENYGHGSAAWVANRAYRPPVGVFGGLCEGGPRNDLLCRFDSDCPRGGTCRHECPLTTDYGRGPCQQGGNHAYGVSTWLNSGNISFYRNLFGSGIKWRKPQISVDQPASIARGGPSQDETLRYEVVQNLSYGGFWMVTHLVDGPRPVDFAFSHNIHENNAATRVAFQPWQGNTDGHRGGPQASFFASSGLLGGCGDRPDKLPCRVRQFFDDNRDLYRDSADDPECDSYAVNAPVGTGVHGVDCRAEAGYSGAGGPFNAFPDWGGQSALRAALLAEAGATLPCRDAVDQLQVDLIAAGDDMRVDFDPLEIGGAQDLRLGCLSGVPNIAPTAQSKVVTVAAGSGIGQWSALVSDPDARPLRLFCYLASAGRVAGRVTDRTACADGAVEGTFDVTGKSPDDYPFTYVAHDGRHADRATGTITVRVQ